MKQIGTHIIAACTFAAFAQPLCAQNTLSNVIRLTGTSEVRAGFSLPQDTVSNLTQNEHFHDGNTFGGTARSLANGGFLTGEASSSSQSIQPFNRTGGASSIAFPSSQDQLEFNIPTTDPNHRSVVVFGYEINFTDSFEETTVGSGVAGSEMELNYSLEIDSFRDNGGDVFPDSKKASFFYSHAPFGRTDGNAQRIIVGGNRIGTLEVQIKPGTSIIKILKNNLSMNSRAVKKPGREDLVATKMDAAARVWIEEIRPIGGHLPPTYQGSSTLYDYSQKPALPSINGLRFVGGRIEFDARGIPGVNYILQGSSNLQDFTDLTDGVISGDTATRSFSLLPDAMGIPAPQYFRIVPVYKSEG